jgi:hypothetical protein
MIVLTLVGLEKVWGLVADRVEIGTSRGSLAYGYGIGIGNGGSGHSTVPGIGRGFGKLRWCLDMLVRLRLKKKQCNTCLVNH